MTINGLPLTHDDVLLLVGFGAVGYLAVHVSFWILRSFFDFLMCFLYRRFPQRFKYKLNRCFTERDFESYQAIHMHLVKSALYAEVNKRMFKSSVDEV